MKLSSLALKHMESIHPSHAFGKIDPVSNIALSNNMNPDFSWSDVPEGTRSFVMICVDVDVPSKGDDVNQTDREIPADLPRVPFYHWTLIDIPATAKSIEAGAYSKEITPKGKAGPSTHNETRQGINNYTDWFANDHDMAGQYFGYDGPCPPFNDSIVHHYHFTLYALDIDRVPVDGVFRAEDVLAAIEPHILAQDTIIGTYTLNPRLSA